MLYVVDVVTGVTFLDNIMYVVCRGSSIIRLYNTDTLSPLDVVIDIAGMRYPRDIVVCRHDRQLYVADWDCIWRVSVDDHSSSYWKNTKTRYRTSVKVDSSHRTLSLTSGHLLLTLPILLRQYSTTNHELLRSLMTSHASLVRQRTPTYINVLPQYVQVLLHAVETTHSTFVVSHRGTSQDKCQYAVSELLRFCHVLQHWFSSVQ